MTTFERRRKHAKRHCAQLCLAAWVIERLIRTLKTEKRKKKEKKKKRKRMTARIKLKIQNKKNKNYNAHLKCFSDSQFIDTLEVPSYRIAVS